MKKHIVVLFCSCMALGMGIAHAEDVMSSAPVKDMSMKQDEMHKKEMMKKDDMHKQEMMKKDEMHKNDMLKKDGVHKKEMMKKDEMHKKEMMNKDSMKKPVPEGEMKKATTSY
ncbi:hypothetical protein AXW37_10055 [Yersinia ruckeri]|uniref:hypothetical protein n=1 Tax=Yersinia ruckeri TaxID=29486 RepID=UPI0004E45B8D|nr:hypothetical protein [Yersinia ruckeri]ARZ01276.1 hypothetical protein QMA0440_01943 [Yersinia ruckeri]EKN4197120.1 hypothetical protein [Yersinia ruckeri]EKN4203774.1 hypothetical protein [Yersinia ruckeri]EKN4702699.1 hypothetical protein [Yersinia ruckeri]ELI6451912.1 hypothetical protein [Yersinia ruckeri]